VDQRSTNVAIVDRCETTSAAKIAKAVKAMALVAGRWVDSSVRSALFMINRLILQNPISAQDVRGPYFRHSKHRSQKRSKRRIGKEKLAPFADHTDYYGDAEFGFVGKRARRFGYNAYSHKRLRLKHTGRDL
jgi:hypothetical protein